MNASGTLLHQYVSMLDGRITDNARRLQALQAVVVATSNNSDRAIDEAASRDIAEAQTKELVKKEIAREKTVLEAALGHRLEQQVTRVLAEGEQLKALTSSVERRLTAAQARSDEQQGTIAELRATVAALTARIDQTVARVDQTAARTEAVALAQIEIRDRPVQAAPVPVPANP